MDALLAVSRRHRELPAPANEELLASYDDGCWISRPLPIYTLRSGILLPKRYSIDLPNSLVEVRATVVYDENTQLQTSSLQFQAQCVRVVEQV